MVFCMHMPPDIDVFFLWCCFFFFCVCVCANVLKETLFFFSFLLALQTPSATPIIFTNGAFSYVSRFIC